MQTAQKTPFYLVILYIISIITMVIFFFSDTLQKTNYVVSGVSMLPTFKDGEEIIYDNRNIEVQRFDCIIFVDCQNQTDIKRVYGLPNDTIKIENNIIYINGNPIEDIIQYNDDFDGGIANQEFQLNENEYFVLGDNRNYSKDSRHKEVGTINKQMIIGIVQN